MPGFSDCGPMLPAHDSDTMASANARERRDLLHFWFACPHLRHCNSTYSLSTSLCLSCHLVSSVSNSSLSSLSLSSALSVSLLLSPLLFLLPPILLFPPGIILQYIISAILVEQKGKTLEQFCTEIAGNDALGAMNTVPWFRDNKHQKLQGEVIRRDHDGFELSRFLDPEDEKEEETRKCVLVLANAARADHIVAAGPVNVIAGSKFLGRQDGRDHADNLATTNLSDLYKKADGHVSKQYKRHRNAVVQAVKSSERKREGSVISTLRLVFDITPTDTGAWHAHECMALADFVCTLHHILTESQQRECVGCYFLLGLP